MRRHHEWISLFVLGVILLGANASAAVTSDIPSAKFNADDWRLQREAQDLVLASSDAGSKHDWQNPATGNSGKIELLRSFQSSDGRECKRLRITNRAGESKNVTTTNACRSGAGKWRMDSTAHT